MLTKRKRMLAFFLTFILSYSAAIILYNKIRSSKFTLIYYKSSLENDPIVNIEISNEIANVSVFKKVEHRKTIEGIEFIDTKKRDALVSDLKQAYMTLKYGNASEREFDDDVNDHIRILPAYDRKTYKKAIEVEWFSYDDFDIPAQKSARNNEPLGVFSQAMEKPPYKLLMDLMEQFVHFFGKNEVEFMMGMGTLIGSCRHLDKIPWDDDMDLIVPKDQINFMNTTLATQIEFPTFQVIYYHGLFRICNRNTSRVNQAPWGYPFVDISYYTNNDTYFHNILKRSFNPISEIYPLRLRPFGKFWLPSPKNELAALAAHQTRDIFKNCYRGNWNHRIDKLQSNDTIACEELRDYYPMVSLDRQIRVGDKIYQIETMNYYDKKMIHLFYYEDVFPITILIDL